MQLDMHYYGTYALARLAGLKPDVCKTIATAAQFVDDNAAMCHIEFQDGGRIDAQATAHHVSNVIANRDVKDQRQVWVPFHFLPGNIGKTFSERLMCRKDSKIAQKMVDHYLKHAQREYGICLIGIAAHIYADTFSHFGFSGVGSRRNKIVNKSLDFKRGMDPDIDDYIDEKTEAFFQRYGANGGLIANVKSWLAETVSGALGHGAVATYPDRPYLKWSFEYEYPAKKKKYRDNPKDFLDGCRALHDMFVRFGKANPKLSVNGGVKFANIENEIDTILRFPARKEDRIEKWCSSARKGEIGGKSFQIPPYDPEDWLRESAHMNSSEISQRALKSNLYRFYQAASINRQYILRELLPTEKLVVA